MGKDSTSLALYIVLPLVIGLLLVFLLSYLFNKFLKAIKYYRAYLLLIQTFIVMLMFGLISWGVSVYTIPNLTRSDWFNGQLTAKTILIGIIANIVFGFFDNAGLFFGVSYLDELFRRLPGGDDSNIVAGYGNTFSDVLGVFLTTFFAQMILDTFGISEGPIWANAIGVVFGCLLGISIPKLIITNSRTTGLNKISSKTVLLGNMGEDELNCIVGGEQTLFDFRAECIFKILKKNMSETLEKEEVWKYMRKTMGGKLNEKDVLEIESSLGRDLDQIHLNDFKEIYMSCAKKMIEHKTRLIGGIPI